MKVEAFPIAKIEVSERLRAVDADWVQGLALSIAESGLQQPIAITRPDKEGRSRLVMGAHRLEACRLLGWEAIPAAFVTGDKLKSRLMEIDENLFRRELNPLDRAVFLAERKSIHEALHPETRHGGDRKSVDFLVGNQSAIIAFRSETAEKLGISVRAVSLSMEIMKIAPDVRAKLVGTPIAEVQKELLALARLGPDMQRKAIKALLREDDPAASVAQAVAEIEGHRTPEPDPLAKMIALWGRIDLKTKRRFFAHLKDTDELSKLVGG